MNQWITTAAHYLFVSWAADAHEDPDSPFDAGEFAAGGGEDWLETMPAPPHVAYNDPEWMTAYLEAYAVAGRFYQVVTERRIDFARSQGIADGHGFYTDLFLAIYHDDSGVSVDAHAHAAVSVALGHGVDDPPPIGGMKWPCDLGGWLECGNNPLR